MQGRENKQAIVDWLEVSMHKPAFVCMWIDFVCRYVSSH